MNTKLRTSIYLYLSSHGLESDDYVRNVFEETTLGQIWDDMNEIKWFENSNLKQIPEFGEFLEEAETLRQSFLEGKHE